MMPRIAISVLFVVFCSGVAAQEYTVEITPFGGYRFGGEFDVTATDPDAADAGRLVKLQDSSAFGVLVDVRHSPITTYQFLYSEQQTDADLNDPDANIGPVSTTIRTLQFGGTYRGDDEVIQPYLAATIGGTHIRTSANGSQDDTFFSGSIGVGVNILPTRRLGFRVEARAYGTLTDSDTTLFCQTGPDANICAVRVDGTILGQFETFAGVTLRF